jgi:hypothetical protein
MKAENAAGRKVGEGEWIVFPLYFIAAHILKRWAFLMGAWLGREQRHLMAVRTRSSKLLPALDVGGRGNLFVPRGGRSDTHHSLEEVEVVVGRLVRVAGCVGRAKFDRDCLGSGDGGRTSGVGEERLQECVTRAIEGV